MIRKLRSATVFAEEIGVPKQILEAGKKGEDCIHLRGKLHEAMAEILCAFPILTQSLYTSK